MLTPPRGACVLAALLVFSLPAMALELEVEVGLGGLLVPGSWTPVRVTCRLDPGEERLRGRVVLDLPRQAVSSCTATIDLEPGQSTTLTLAAPVGLASGDYRVRVVDADGVTLLEEVPEETWSMLGDDQRLVVLLGKPSLQAFRSEHDLLPRTVHLEPTAFPREPRVLAGADAIFLKGDRGAGLRELARDPDAVAALRQYVLEGGRLVVLADQGEQTQPFWRERPLADLLPVVHVRGQTELSPAQLERALGVAPDGPVWSLDVLQAPGATPAPCVSRDLGRGRVSVVTFDVDHPLLRPLGGTTGFLVGLVRHPVKVTPRLRDEELSEVTRLVFQSRAAIGSLGLALLIACVAAHLISLGPLTSYVTRRRSAWAGLAVPPAASLLLAGLIMVGATLLRGPPRAQAMIYTFQDPVAPQAWSQVDVGLFAGASETFSLDLGGQLRPKAQPRPQLDALRFRRPSPALEFAGGRPDTVAPIHLTARGHTWLELAATVETTDGGPLSPPPVRAQLRSLPDEDWQLLEVSHGGEETLEHVLLVGIGLGETRYNLLRLEPGESLTWDPKSGVKLPSPPALDQSPFSDTEARAALLVDLARRLERERHRAAAAASPLERISFPAYWVVTLRPVEAGAFSLEGASSGPLETSQLQAAFIPAQEQP